MRTKLYALLLSALLCTLITSGVMASAPAPYTTATPETAPAAPAVPARAVKSPEEEKLTIVLEDLHNRIKRCAEMQDRSVRITCYDNMAVDLGYITPDRIKNEGAELQKIGFWQMSEKIGADGIKSTYMRVESSNTIASRNGTERQVSFVIKCSPGQTDAFLDWKSPIIDGFSSNTVHTQMINYYSESRVKQAENWEISTDRQALFAPDAIAFVRNLMQKGKLTIEFSSYAKALQTATFDIRGIDTVVDTIVKACY